MKKKTDPVEQRLQAIYDEAVEQLKRSACGSLEELQDATLAALALHDLTEYRKRK